MTTTNAAAQSRVRDNHAAFRAAVERAEARFRAGRPLDAAVLAGVASNLATWMHPGLFASGDLERVSSSIGRAIADQPGDPSRPRGGDVHDVLHVFTRALSVGGHTRMVWRWMGLDPQRRHSVAITRQGGRAVPPELVTGSVATGGTVVVLERHRGTLLDRARRLHELASRADVVVLHVDPEDVIPSIAFADRSDLPPVLYLNHADHLFWLGIGIADLVVNLRWSGHRLSPQRRGVTEERNAFIPITLDERHRTMGRDEAKRRLGLPTDTVVLATVARAAKFAYRSNTGETYLDAVVPIVQEFDDVRLVIVGPSQTGDFQAAHAATGGRVSALGERTDNETLYQAADVYVDSYPQMSPTSLLEAGCYATPLIALQPLIDDADILCGDAPGIDRGLIRARSVGEFQMELRDLIVDPKRRAELGDRIRADIDRLHVGHSWTRQLEELYRQALRTPSLREAPSIPDLPHEGPPDTMIVTGSEPVVDAGDVLLYHIRLLPLRGRIRSWWTAVRSGKHPSLSLLLSETTMVRLKYARRARGKG